MMMRFRWSQQSDDDVVVVDIRHATPLAGMQHVHRVTSECVQVRWVPSQFAVGQGEIRHKVTKTLLINRVCQSKLSNLTLYQN